MNNISNKIEQLVKAKCISDHKNLECASSIGFYWTFKPKHVLLDICTSYFTITYYIKDNHHYKL